MKMKKLLLMALVCTPFIICAQRSVVGLQAFRMGTDIEDKRVNFEDKGGWAAGLSFEQVFKNDIWGLKGSAQYTQRRAALSDIALEYDALTLSFMPVVHVDDIEHEWANLVFGGGLYVQFPAFDPESDVVFRKWDWGMAFELGWSFKRVTVLAMAQKSFPDVVKLPYIQHWVGFGLGAQVDLIRTKKQ